MMNSAVDRLQGRGDLAGVGLAGHRRRGRQRSERSDPLPRAAGPEPAAGRRIRLPDPGDIVDDVGKVGVTLNATTAPTAAAISADNPMVRCTDGNRTMIPPVVRSFTDEWVDPVVGEFSRS